METLIKDEMEHVIALDVPLKFLWVGPIGRQRMTMSDRLHLPAHKD